MYLSLLSFNFSRKKNYRQNSNSDVYMVYDQCRGLYRCSIICISYNVFKSNLLRSEWARMKSCISVGQNIKRNFKTQKHLEVIEMFSALYSVLFQRIFHLYQRVYRNQSIKRQLWIVVKRNGRRTLANHWKGGDARKYFYIRRFLWPDYFL